MRRPLILLVLLAPLLLGAVPRQEISTASDRNRRDAPAAFVPLQLDAHYGPIPTTSPPATTQPSPARQPSDPGPWLITAGLFLLAWTGSRWFGRPSRHRDPTP